MDSIYRPVVEKWAQRGTRIEKYMDDIAIATSTNEADHTEAVMDVLQVAEDHDLYFKPKKCVFHTSRIDYLGVILEKGMIRMDPIKIEGIKNWPSPTKVKDVRSFLGFCNFYRPFIPKFGHDAKPLNELTKKEAPWQWGPRQQEAMDNLKNKVTSAPVLRSPELDKQFEVEVDALGYAIGAVLLQRKEDGKKHPIAYYSATLNAAERNYDIYELEYLAIHRACMHWRPFLAGSPHKVVVWSDHQNLTYWKDPQKLSRRIARQCLDLMEFDIEIRHLPCYVFIGLWTASLLPALSFHISIYIPLITRRCIGLPSFVSLIFLSPHLQSTLTLSSGASLIPLSVAVPLSPCTIHQLTKRWYCRLWTMSPSPCYFTRSSPSAVYKDVLVAA